MQPQYALLATLSLTAAIPAQVVDVIVPPTVKNTDGMRQSTFPFGPTAGRTQQVIHKSQLGEHFGMIQEISFRQDAFLSTNEKARQVPRVIVSLGETQVFPGSMSTRFAKNRGGTMTVVFDKAFDLPPPGTGSPRPFDLRFKLSSPYVYYPAQGHLLLEIEIPGKATRTGYVVDAALSTLSGTSTTFGTHGKFASGDKLDFRNPSPDQLKPGGQIELGASGLMNGYPALAVFGFSKSKYGPLSLPFDLGALGAPGNNLYASLDLVVPLVLNPYLVGWGGSVGIPLPDAPWLDRLEVYGQGLFIDRKSNALGAVFSNRVDMTIGSGLLFTEQIVSEDPSAAEGSRTLEPMGNVVSFTGVFR